MSEILVSLNNVSKSYILFRRPQDRLKESLFKYFGKHYGSAFWALRDISFKVSQGEALGIIGRNGSGKSTLLEIIAGTLQPTTGAVAIKGRIAAMLELGAGFNPEFTGRENIFLNSAILGLSDKQTREHLDQIINFADIGKFIDQPVKIYSSGMYVRLAFAIAVSVEPEILIIDEALSVGDAGFVIKCMNRMKQMKANGTTIILVTHDVQTVRSFCDTALWLKDGSVQSIGLPLEVTSRYIQYLFDNQDNTPKRHPHTTASETSPTVETRIDLHNRTDLIRWGSGQIQIVSCWMNSGHFRSESIHEYGESIQITVKAQVLSDLDGGSIGFGMALRNRKGLDIITSTTFDEGYRFHKLHAGQIIFVAFDFTNILAPGDYALVLNIEDRKYGTPQYIDFIENTKIFQVVSNKHIFSLVLPQVQQTITIENVH